jgi:hypothetical protein
MKQIIGQKWTSFLTSISLSPRSDKIEAEKRVIAVALKSQKLSRETKSTQILGPLIYF